MDIKEQKAIIEAMLFASGRAIKIEEFMAALELPRKETELICNKCVWHMKKKIEDCKL